MGLDLDYMEGQTPLDEEEKNGLRIPTITTHGELDEFEQKNIEEASLSSMCNTILSMSHPPSISPSPRLPHSNT